MIGIDIRTFAVQCAQWRYACLLSAFVRERLQSAWIVTSEEDMDVQVVFDNLRHIRPVHAIKLGI